MYETEELGREEVKRVGSNQSIIVLELRRFKDRRAGQGGGREGWDPINPCSRAMRYETEELARAELERVGPNQSIPVLEL